MWWARTLATAFLVGAFEEKCSTLTVGSFYTLKVHFFVQLELRMSKPYWKRQNLVQNKTNVQKLENILRIPFGYLDVFNLDFFGTMRLFFRKFFDYTKGSYVFPSFFCNFAIEWMLKYLKGSPLYIFGAVTQILNFCFFFFEIFLMSPKSPLARGA